MAQVAVQWAEQGLGLNWLFPGSASHMLVTLEESVSLVLSFLPGELHLHRPVTLGYEV